MPSQLRLAITRLARRLRQQSVGDVTASQFSALATVAKCGPMSLGELAGIERVAPPSMTRIAARIEEQGLITRTADEIDRRVARVIVTEAGLAVLDETRTRRDAYLADRLHRLSLDEQEIVARALPLLERLAAEDD
jgi:DNA-binding MarR family transcriptional regulator